MEPVPPHQAGALGRMVEGEVTAQDWRRLFGGHPSITLLLDPTERTVVAANDAAERFYGYDASVLTGLRLEELAVPAPVAAVDLDGRPVLPAWASSVLGDGQDGGPPWRAVARHRLADGKQRDVEVVTAPMRVEGRQLLTAVIHDLSGQQRALRLLSASEENARRRIDQLGDQLDASQRRFEALVEHARDPILVLDQQQRITYLSPAAAAFLGSPSPSIEDILARVDERDRRQLGAVWRALLAGPHPIRQHVVRLARADGRRRDLALTLSDLRGLDAVAGVVVTARDLTDELTVRSRLEHQTTHDGLTGLANRDLLLEELRRFLAPTEGDTPGETEGGNEGETPGEVQRDAGEEVRPGALVLLDLIGMAGINDRVGHRTGDYLLRAVARRLQEAVGPHGTVARTSGDEFGVLLPSDAGEAAALALAHDLDRLFDEPFATPGGGTLLLRVRAGAASTSTSGGTPAGVLRDANLALSAAQASDTERIRVCDDALRREEERRLRLEYELSTPAITEQFHLAYQPLVDLRTGAVPCLEALLLWDHPELGEIGPGEFVPVAERNGAIVPIGAWVLRRACEQLAAWDDEGVDPSLQLAINVSARQLLDVDLVPTVAGVLEDTGLAPHRLALEVTETVLADHSDVTTAKLQAMADVGVRIHIDDFGTGYSSFAQLGRFPFHGLKIDRSFVTPLGVDDDADPVISALLAIAGAQGLEVIAEGVDAEVQVAHLRALGCQLAQGYLWSRPLAPDAVPAFLAGPQPVPPPATSARPG